MRYRIWELDAVRGICMIGMVLIHFVYDLVSVFGIVTWQYPGWFVLVLDWGSVLFVILSGICATIGRHCRRRGFVVLLAGMGITVVTICLHRLGLAGAGIRIYFGILHCLGVCMLLWSVLRRLPNGLLVAVSVVLCVLGYWLERVVLVDHLWLLPLGLTNGYFVSADYFPLLPYLGYFLAGAVIGRTVYRRKETRLPVVNSRNPILRGLCCVGRHSLGIYLLHQPILCILCLMLQ